MFSVEVWVEILKRVGKKGRIACMQTCQWMYDIALIHVWKPWKKIGKNSRMTGLAFACKNNFVVYYVKWSLMAGKDWNPASLEYGEALEQALINNREALCEIMLTKNCCLPSESTIFYCARYGSVNIFQILLNDKRIDLFKDRLVLVEAIKYGNYKVVKILLRDSRMNLEWQDGALFRFLFCSPTLARKTCKELLKDSRICPEIGHALSFACEKGLYGVVKLLVKDYRVNVAISDNYPIRTASKNGHLAIVSLLLKDKRVDPTACHNYALRVAIEQGNLDMVKLLLTHPSVDPTKPYKSPDSPLTLAEMFDHTHIVDFLKGEIDKRSNFFQKLIGI